MFNKIQLTSLSFTINIRYFVYNNIAENALFT